MMDYEQAVIELENAVDSLDQAVSCLDEDEALRMRAIKLRSAVEVLSTECTALISEIDSDEEVEEEEEEAE